MQPVRNRGYGRRLAAVLATGSLVLSFAAAAGADTVYNTLDNSIDAIHEAMTLPVGGVGTTTLEIKAPKGQLAGDDHPGCNIQGNGPHQLAMAASSSNAGIVAVSFLNNDNVFDNCDEVLTVNVTGLVAGSTTVTFVGTPDTSNDPHITFSYGEATFDVTVTAVTTPPPVVCDADPAAPAWANAILKANGIKNKTTMQNTISSVAHHMTQGAKFDGVAKSVHPAYENAVYNYMTAATPGGLGLTLPLNAQQSARPGWECSSL
jgi:hypothetical protein